MNVYLEIELLDFSVITLTTIVSASFLLIAAVLFSISFDDLTNNDVNMSISWANWSNNLELTLSNTYLYLVFYLLGVKAALHSTTIPRVKIATMDGGQPELEITDDPLDGYRLNVTQSPILVTLCRIGMKLLFYINF